MNRGFSFGFLLLALVLCIAGAIALVLFFGATALGKGVATYSRDVVREQVIEQSPPAAVHINTPPYVRAVYMSQCAAATDSFRRDLLSLINETELNAIVIDVKDFTGTVSFPRGNTVEDLGGTGCVVSDMKDFVARLHDQGVYVIGRITVFQDPLYTSIYPELAVQSKSNPGTPWKDYKGLSFVDVGARPFWDYIVAIARESHAIGFDELNFDYIRYPSDGPMSDVQFDHSDYTQRPVELEKFFRYLSGKVRRADANGYVPVLSADLFGMTTTNYDDLTIGQVLERATPYFDYIAPMTYPSHYPPGFNGYANPNNNVYGVVRYSAERAIERVESATTTIAALAYTPVSTSTPYVYRKPARDRNVLRLWLQDFDYGGDYGPTEVRAQIQALYDVGLHSWMLWAPSNRYTKAALEPTEQSQ
jgi:hypothetical protein